MNLHVYATIPHTPPHGPRTFPALLTVQPDRLCPVSPATHIPAGRQHQLMPPEGLYGSPALPWLLSFFGSVSALGILFFVILPNCSGPAGKGSGTWSCGSDMPVVYLCSFLFLAGAVYSTYRLVRVGMEGRGG